MAAGLMAIPPAVRLHVDSQALLDNYRWLSRQGGSADCGAVIKANGYGLGARRVLHVLADAGCRYFFVATWQEAAALSPWPAGIDLSVLHGVRAEDMAVARLLSARPVLNSPTQLQRWRALGGARPCDIMIDTGMNRLGFAVTDIADIVDIAAASTGAGAGTGWKKGSPIVETLMSHLACADEDSAMNGRQVAQFSALKSQLSGQMSAQRYSLANSAGICLGRTYSFDLTRPGLALYGGVPRREAVGHIRQVITPEAQILQRRRIRKGETIGYGATWTAPQDSIIVIVNIGYADGYYRSFSGQGGAYWGDVRLPLVGRVSMNLLIFEANKGAAQDLREGDWVALEYDLPTAAAASGVSQYELLTSLSGLEKYGPK